MAIESKTRNYNSHKNKYNVYVEVNPKTKQGQDLLKQYHEQSSRHYMDIGRIGYHDEYGRYKIDNYTVRELKVVPKLIISVLKSAMNRAGKDVYKLRTYMSKFGQLNFLLTVDSNCSELFLIENVYISNLNHREDYETLIWRMNHQNENPVPLKQIFYEYGIKANPDDYGKSWKNGDVKINNIIVSKSKAALSVKIANEVGNAVNKKVLVASLNNLNASGKYGEKITKNYREEVAKKKEITNLANSQKLENTLNQVLIKTIDQKTEKKDLKNRSNAQTYKNVVDVQFSASKEVAEGVEQEAEKTSLNGFIEKTYEKADDKQMFVDDKEKFDKEQGDFENIIGKNSKKEVNKEKVEVNLEVFDKAKYKGKTLPNEYRDFENKKIEINFETDRFLVQEDKKDKKKREKLENKENKLKIKQEKDQEKQHRKLKLVKIDCNIEEALEKSKVKLGIKSQIIDKKEKKKQKKEQKLKYQEKKKEDLLLKIEKRVKKQNEKIALKKEKKEKKKKKVIEQRLKKEEKKKKKREQQEQFFEEKKEKKVNKIVNKKQKNKNNDFRPVVKIAEEAKSEDVKKVVLNQIRQEHLQTRQDAQNNFNQERVQSSFKENKIAEILNRKNNVQSSAPSLEQKKKKEQTLEM